MRDPYKTADIDNAKGAVTAAQVLQEMQTQSQSI